MSTRILKIIIPVLFIAACLGAAVVMLKHPVTPERAPTKEKVVRVEVQALKHTSAPAVVEAQGTVAAARQVRLRPEVSGRLVEISDQLVPGGRFKMGEVMARIDPRDYEALVAHQRQAVANAALMLQQEKSRQAIAREEWAMLEDGIPRDQTNRDLALRIPQIEHATASLDAANAALATAELNLKRCTIEAPFNAVVISENAEVGEVVNPQMVVATLAGTDEAWVQVSVPVEYLSWIPLPEPGKPALAASSAKVYLEGDRRDHSHPAVVLRLLRDLDPAGRMARLLLSIDDPFGLESGASDSGLPLLLGSYVHVEMTGTIMEDVVEIQRSALRDLDSEGDGPSHAIWLMNDEDRLEIRPVDLVWRTRDVVYVRNGFHDQERLVISGLATPVEGLKLSLTPPQDKATPEDVEALHASR